MYDKLLENNVFIVQISRQRVLSPLSQVAFLKHNCLNYFKLMDHLPSRHNEL